MVEQTMIVQPSGILYVDLLKYKAKYQNILKKFPKRRFHPRSPQMDGYWQVPWALNCCLEARSSLVAVLRENLLGSVDFGSTSSSGGNWMKPWYLQNHLRAKTKSIRKMLLVQIERKPLKRVIFVKILLFFSIQVCRWQRALTDKQAF